MPSSVGLASAFVFCASSRVSFVPNSSVIATAAIMAMRSALSGWLADSWSVGVTEVGLTLVSSETRHGDEGP